MNRDRFVNLGLVVGGLFVSLVLGELALRMVDYDYNPMAITDGGLGDDRVEHLFNQSDFVSDPELIWRPRAGGIFNAAGFSGPEITKAKRREEFRIFTIGDSNTLGWQDGTGWVADVRELLRRETSAITVVNAGVWGYSSHQGVARTRQVRPYRPDLVTISFGSNDARRVGTADADFVGGLRDPRWSSFLSRWRLGQIVLFLRDALSGLGSGGPRARVAVEAYADNLRAMVVEARTAGSAVLLMTRPYVGTSAQPLWWKNFAPAYNRATVAVADELDVPVIDLYTHFKDRDELFADESHFNVTGHRLAAALVIERLRPFLPPIDSS